MPTTCTTKAKVNAKTEAAEALRLPTCPPKLPPPSPEAEENPMEGTGLHVMTMENSRPRKIPRVYIDNLEFVFCCISTVCKPCEYKCFMLFLNLSAFICIYLFFLDSQIWKTRYSVGLQIRWMQTSVHENPPRINRHFCFRISSICKSHASQILCLMPSIFSFDF
jgi:hypothetical protein